MIKKGLFLVSLLSLCFSFNSFAYEVSTVDNIMNYEVLPDEVRTTLTNSLLNLKEFNDEITYFGTWKEIEDDAYIYINNKGEKQYGYLYGENGDIYYQPSNSDSIIVDDNINLVYFDKIGRMSNYASDPHNNYLDDFIELEDNGSVLLHDVTEADVEHFIEIYMINYRLFNQQLTYHDEPQGNGDRLVSLKYPLKKTSSDIKEIILSKFIPLKGNSDYEKIVDMCDQLRSISYDIDYINEDFETCLENNKGVCWHYAKIGKVLLEDAGIYAEVLPCRSSYNNNKHVILRCKIDDSWIYCDPTDITNASYLKAIIPYSNLVKDYKFAEYYG